MDNKAPFRIRVSISLILTISLAILVAVPALMLRGLVRQTAQQAVESEVAHLSVGILDEARQNLGDRLEHLQDAFPHAAGLKAGLSVSLAYLDLPLGDAYLIPLDDLAGPPAYRLESETGRDPQSGQARFRLEPADLVPDRKSQSLSILREHPDRGFWLGHLPFLPRSDNGLWLAGLIRWGERPAILALSIQDRFLTEFLNRLAVSVASTIYLITADNVVLPAGRPDFFAQSFAARALSRTKEGVFFSFLDQQADGSGNQDVLVHVYADPDYLYNLVAVTPRAILTHRVDEVINQTTILTALVAGLLGFLTLGLVLLLTRHLRALTGQLQGIADGDFRQFLPGQLIILAETDRIAHGINNLANRLEENQLVIEEARHGLEKRVTERTTLLTNALHDLQDTQDVLVQTEKMAALGRMVAAFTHEINNPLGASVTALSKLQETISELKRDFDAKVLTASNFRNSLDLITTAADLVANSLHRATTITGSFKHVAADQSHEEIREFSLGAYLEETVNSLQPVIRKGRHQVKLQIDPAIRLRANPAHIYQIFSNLVINSLNHGFAGRESGTITIRGQSDGAMVQLEYRDDGLGMGPEQLSRLYEPFYTTNRANGGTGLGMSIVYSLVHDELGGSILCESEVGAGVRFTIRFPSQPAKEGA